MPSNITIDHLAPIEALPDDVLFHVIEYCPQLGMASRKLRALSELLESHCLACDYAALSEQRLLERTQRNRTIAKFLSKHSFSVLGESSMAKRDNIDSKISKKPSARALRKFLNKDYCFFSHQNLVSSSENHLDHDDQHQQKPLNTASETSETKHIADSFFLSSTSKSYGLFVDSNSHSSSVRYKTRLAPGRYEVFIHMTASNAFGLLPMRFSVPENPFVRQNFPPFPPGKIAVGAHETLSAGTEIYLGDITVTNSMAYTGYVEDMSANDDTDHPHQHHQGTWPFVEFEITEVGKFSDIQLNYLSFEPKPLSPQHSSGLITPPRHNWELVNREFEPSASVPPITPELIAAYNELNRLKLH
jgi:hypothetical protein